MVLLGFWTVTPRPPPPQLCQSQLKFQSYSTQLHSKDYHSDNKEFLENFPVSQENLHCVPNQYKIDPQFHIQFHIQCFNLLLDYLLLLEISHLFHKSSHRASNLAKNIFEEISPFSRKTYIVCKIWTKMVLLGIEVLPLDYVTINQNFTPIPQLYTQNTTILTKKNFWKISQFSRKTYIVW